MKPVGLLGPGASKRAITPARKPIMMIQRILTVSPSSRDLRDNRSLSLAGLPLIQEA
jgi:hypothetical protein